jgi:hypothetical protein
MDAYRDEVYAAAYILDLGTELAGFIAGHRVPSNQWIGGCKGPKTCLNVIIYRTMFLLPGSDLSFLACSQSCH